MDNMIESILVDFFISSALGSALVIWVVSKFKNGDILVKSYKDYFAIILTVLITGALYLTLNFFTTIYYFEFNNGLLVHFFVDLILFIPFYLTISIPLLILVLWFKIFKYTLNSFYIFKHTNDNHYIQIKRQIKHLTQGKVEIVHPNKHESLFENYNTFSRLFYISNTVNLEIKYFERKLKTSKFFHSYSLLLLLTISLNFVHVISLGMYYYNDSTNSIVYIFSFLIPSFTLIFQIIIIKIILRHNKVDIDKVLKKHSN